MNGIQYQVIRITGVAVGTNHNYLIVSSADRPVLPSVQHTPIIIDTETSIAKLPSLVYFQRYDASIGAIQISAHPTNGKLIYWLGTALTKKYTTIYDDTGTKVWFETTPSQDPLSGMRRGDYIVPRQNEDTGRTFGATLYNGVAYVVVTEPVYTSEEQSNSTINSRVEFKVAHLSNSGTAI
jgi:hypothetical protein